MTIILRLNPALPALWRSLDEMQFGVPAVAVLSPVESWQQRLITELTSGMPESAVMVWADMLSVNPARVRELLATLSPAIVRVDPDLTALMPRVRLHSARVADDARFLSTLRGVFVDAGIAITGESPVTASAAPVPAPAAAPALAVVLAHFAVSPRLSGALLSSDTPHLPIVVDGSGIHVGPLVMPGETGCLHCVDLHRIDRDSAWPVLATQLLERTAPEPAPLLTLEAASLAARFIAGSASAAQRFASTAEAGVSVSVRAADARREWHRHRPHPLCGCQSLAESATVRASRVRPSVTTTARALRVPA